MESTVRVQITVSMDLHLATDQTKYDVARGVQHQVNALLEQHNLGQIDGIKVFEGQGTALSLSMNEPAVELEGKDGVNGWEHVRKSPTPPEHRKSTLPLGARSASDLVSIAFSPAAAQEWEAAPKGLRPAIRQKRKKEGKKEAKVPKPNKTTQDKQFGHDFEDRTFNKRYRQEGISAALGPQFVDRIEKNRARRNARDKKQRWKGHDNPDDEKQMEIINHCLASIDLEASERTKAERRAERKAKRENKSKAAIIDTEDVNV